MVQSASPAILLSTPSHVDLERADLGMLVRDIDDTIEFLASDQEIRLALVHYESHAFTGVGAPGGDRSSDSDRQRASRSAPRTRLTEFTLCRAQTWNHRGCSPASVWRQSSCDGTLTWVQHVPVRSSTGAAG
jgi:hypothetical protein